MFLMNANKGHFLSMTVKDEKLDESDILFCEIERDDELLKEILRRLEYVYVKFIFCGDNIQKIPDKVFEEFKVDRTTIKKRKIK